MKISSRQNPWFKRLREAIRLHDEEIVIEGPKAVDDALSAGWKPLAIVRRGLDSSASERELAFASELFDALAETKTSQGVLGLFERPQTSIDALLANRESIVVALDGVQDPGNVGTIVRLAAAFDAAGVALLPGCADPFGPKAIRASVGAILTVPVANVTPVALIESGLPLFAADGSGAPIDPPTHGAILVFGNEGAGVSAELLEAATPIAIATSGRVESLNVAASAAILLARSF
ncbi:MAG: RNA methyltransferase, partial [Acidobacteria bacterium]|nr:RNA methyltransferase [Acidobacteriota bacterium]